MESEARLELSSESSERAIEAISRYLVELGIDLSDERLRETPRRIVEGHREMLSGYRFEASSMVGETIPGDHDGMVIVGDIGFASLCEHHMLPFFGKAHVAYIPNGRIVGLSKLPRLVEAYARRLQVQERLTEEIAGTLYKVLKPRGVGVVLEAEHLCVSMRGVKNETSFATTSAMLGCFHADNRVREEFLNLIKKQ